MPGIDKTDRAMTSVTAQEALDFHSQGRPGKLEISPTKPMATQRDLSLAYSPGVAVPVKAIADDPATAYDYTARGNMVAVISNGTAILGLGNLGALASKPVMEGKAVLFKRFADVDSIDLEVDTENVDEFVNCVRFLGPSFGGINLEDIKAPDCFIIEQRLREVMDIPVFHDDQHGTAIIAAAGLVNALTLTGRDFKTAKLVCNGAGAAAIACIELIKAMGFNPENIILCDTKGVIYKGRTDGMNQWKSAHAVETDRRTLAEALDGADVFFGLSAKGALSADMVRSMGARPIIFAMANPDPEITPEEVALIRDDAIVATGRSDYPNQVNNVLGFPYIFRGALDVRASTINDAMKIAAAEALANLAKEDVPDDVAAAYQGNRPRFGPQYIIPVPFDPRLISAIPMAVAKAAMETGVARKPIEDLKAYGQQLSARRDPIASTLQRIVERVRRQPKRIVFAEGEEVQMMRSAIAYANQQLGTALLLGREEVMRETAEREGIDLDRAGIQIVNARLSKRVGAYTDFLYSRLQRKGYLFRDVQRLINTDRNHFAASMVALGDADGMVTGLTRNYSTALEDVRRCIDPKPGHRVIGVSIALCRGRTVLVADTAVHDMPTSEELADIAEEAAGLAKRLGYVPRVAMLAYSTFGHPSGERSERVREAVKILDRRRVDFEYDGEMAADVALNARVMEQYPFCRLSGTANVLVMPAFHSASISTKMLQELGGSTVIGPLLVGLDKSVQIASMSAKDSDLVNLAAIAAYNAGT
ncbi:MULTISPECIES: NADP-dependent malic enzyme [Sinorhizobium]|jgi:malate dehydrogenase (oxaloacetate-decarboxylating)(NADP+)|uniref:NADP-dependent malic enzyme n=4 Tax=Sinorhizobium TaxID=28105 RepID=MAO2_RHIME|nr:MULTISPECIES: NADP-dependent malic enzyme [Sinorhizobium]O30808.2 RecName: Full=NADP-dependent malic enzyme; Short=NADP-ME [Sinorhizobium meliloti 1021]PST29445.1 NADP-dependent malic enzyme [Mesorhizobium loti]TWA99962.1 allosteric NADP-dependent malic enzyme [Ensifer sp. SEMIA 134]TWB34401.1 allosteric NADP-dependent malic enzyme [Ensifer sp. SEMIA 135]AEG02979.1 malic protein NAD-binding protein [Sinorhizobium meliloti BL225C]AEG51802.1 malic protein NAD-binding protein [Sinorhizobium m